MTNLPTRIARLERGAGNNTPPLTDHVVLIGVDPATMAPVSGTFMDLRSGEQRPATAEEMADAPAH